MFLFALGVACAAVAGPSPAAVVDDGTGKRGEASLQVRLESGVVVRGVAYKQERMARKWLLQIKPGSGLTLSSPEGAEKRALTGDEFHELLRRLLGTIGRERQGRLDSIHIGLGLVEPLWEHAVAFLHQERLDSMYRVRPKDLIVARALTSFLQGSSFVADVCRRVEDIGCRCRPGGLSMDPIAFPQPYAGRSWGEVKAAPDAGINKERLWYEVRLEVAGDVQDARPQESK